MAQGQSALEAAWGEVEKAQSAESAWAEVEAAQKKTDPNRGKFSRRVEEPGTLRSMLGSALAGMSGSVESGLGMVSEVYRAGRELTGAPNIPGVTSPLTDLRGMSRPEAAGAIESIAPTRDPSKMGGLERFLVREAPEAAGSSLGSLLFAGALGPLGPALGLGAKGTAILTGAGSGALVNAGQAYDETLAKTGSKRKAWEAAGWNALIGTTEAADTLILGGLGKPAVKELTGTIRQKIGRIVRETLMGAATEATQEGIQQTLSAKVDAELTGAQKDYLAEFLHAAALGGFIGAGMGFSGETLRAAMQRRPKSVQAEPEQPKPAQPEPTIKLAGLEGVTAKPVEEQAAPAPEPTPEPEPVDPFLEKKNELEIVNLEIRKLDSRAKEMRQKGKTQESIPVDQKRLELLKEQQKLALEMQEIAASRRVSGAPPAAPLEAEAPGPSPRLPSSEAAVPVEPSLGERAKLRAETRDLQSFVRSVGGIRGDTPEGRLLYGGLSEKEVGRQFGLGPIVRSPKSTKGLNWEHAKEKAFEAGFFPQHEQSGDITFQEFADALTENRQHPEQMERVAAAEQQASAKQEDEAYAHYAEQDPEAARLYEEEQARQRAEFQADLDRINRSPSQQAAIAAEEGDTSFDPSAWEEEVREGIEEDLSAKGDPAASSKAAEQAQEIVRTSDALGEPPGPPKPPVPMEEIPEPDDENAPDRIMRWIGERQLAHAEADRTAGLYKKAIDKTLSGKLGRFFTERIGRRDRRARFQIEKAGLAAIDTRGKLDDEFAKYGSELKPEHLDTLKRMQALTPEQRAIIESAIEDNRRTSQLALDEEVISEAHDIYTKRLWKGEIAADPMPHSPRGEGKFTTFTTGALPRSYSSVLQGWSLGNELALPSFIDAAAWNKKTVADVIANRNLIKDGVKAGWLRSVNPGEGWVAIEHPNFQSEVLRARITAPESAESLREQLKAHLGEDVGSDEAVKVYGRSREGITSLVAGRDMRIVPRGDDILVFQKMPLFARKDNARIINNVLGRSALTKWFEQGTRAGKIGAAIDKFAVIAKTLRTAGINDNLVFLALRNFGAQPTNALRAGSDLLTAAPYRRGKKMIEMWGPDAQGLVANGLRMEPLADMQPYFELERGRLQKKLEGMKIVGAPARFITNTYVDLQNFLYGKYIPAMKLNLAKLELDRLRRVNKQRLMEGSITDEALQKAAAQLSNSALGGQNWQRFAGNPTAMHVAQLAFLAPDRMTSNIRLAADAFRSGATGAAHRALWARMASRYVFMWLAANLAMAWQDDPDHPVDAFARRARQAYGLGFRELFGVDVSPALKAAGRSNPSRLFVLLNAQANEALEGAQDPTGYFKRKLGILPQIIGGLRTGEDYFGRTYTTFMELLGKDERGRYKTTEPGKHYAGQEKGGRLAGQFSSYQSGATPGHLRFEQFPSFVAAHAPIPFEAQAWLEVLQGQTDTFDALLQTLGMRTIAPSAKRQKEMEKATATSSGGDFDLRRLYQ